MSICNFIIKYRIPILFDFTCMIGIITQNIFDWGNQSAAYLNISQTSFNIPHGSNTIISADIGQKSAQIYSFSLKSKIAKKKNIGQISNIKN